MNNVLSAQADQRTTHPPERLSYPAKESVAHTTRVIRRVGVIDRLALRVGIALIKWGRRREVPSRTELATRHTQRVLREERERTAERRYLLG